jgi:hypothetical protein
VTNPLNSVYNYSKGLAFIRDVADGHAHFGARHWDARLARCGVGGLRVERDLENPTLVTVAGGTTPPESRAQYHVVPLCQRLLRKISKHDHEFFRKIPCRAKFIAKLVYSDVVRRELPE